MRLFRAIFPLFLTLLLLFSQQGGAMHALRHTLADHDQQHEKHMPHSSACGYCAAYTQLGSVLGSSSISFSVVAITGEVVWFDAIAFRSNQPLVVVARGPPSFLQKIA